jgi:lipopolysaccharide biosynthesis protein
MKHLIYIYCYHIELLDEFLENCYPTVEEFDMVDMHIDFSHETYTEELLKKIEGKRITYSVRENRGMDILPFVKTLYDIVFPTDEYSVITKIQSKVSDNDWRKWAYIPLFRDFSEFEQMHLFIEDNIRCGIPIMLNHRLTLDNYEMQRAGHVHGFDKIKELNDKFFHFEKISGSFFAGTMFMTSTLFLKSMFNGVDYEEFSSMFESGKPLTGYAHAMERLFGYAVENFGGKMVGIGKESEPIRKEHTEGIEQIIKGTLEF